MSLTSRFEKSMLQKTKDDRESVLSKTYDAKNKVPRRTSLLKVGALAQAAAMEFAKGGLATTERVTTETGDVVKTSPSKMTTDRSRAPQVTRIHRSGILSNKERQDLIKLNEERE